MRAGWRASAGKLGLIVVDYLQLMSVLQAAVTDENRATANWAKSRVA
jgi:replicative DNA helicase